MGMILAKFQHLPPYRQGQNNSDFQASALFYVMRSFWFLGGRGKQTGHANLKRRGPFFTASSRRDLRRPLKLSRPLATLSFPFLVANGGQDCGQVGLDLIVVD